MNTDVSFLHVMVLFRRDIDGVEYDLIRLEYLQYISFTNEQRKNATVHVSIVRTYVIKLLAINFVGFTITVLCGSTPTTVITHVSGGICNDLLSIAIVVIRNSRFISNSDIALFSFLRKKKVFLPPVEEGIIDQFSKWLGNNLKEIAVGVAIYPNLKALSNILYSIGEFLVNPARNFSLGDAIVFSYKLVLEEIWYIVKSPGAFFKGLGTAIQRWYRGGKFLK